MSLTLSHDSSCHLVESLAVSALAEFIRELIVEGTRPGLDATRARGRTGGRKPKLNGRQVATVRRMYEAVGPASLRSDGAPPCRPLRARVSYQR